jgi:hypothetical protein
MRQKKSAKKAVLYKTTNGFLISAASEAVTKDHITIPTQPGSCCFVGFLGGNTHAHPLTPHTHTVRVQGGGGKECALR